LVKDLYKENLKKDAEQGGTKAKNEIKMKQDSLITQAKKLSDEFKKAQEMPNGPEKFKELERIQEEFRRINEE
jgi:sensor c-di-GMP phosphodiesterase-like protein